MSNEMLKKLPALLTGILCFLAAAFCLIVLISARERLSYGTGDHYFQMGNISARQLGASYGDIEVEDGFMLYAVEWSMTNQSNHSLSSSSARLYYDSDIGWVNLRNPSQAAPEIGYGNQYVIPGGLTGKVYEILEIPARATKLLVYDSPDREEPIAELPLR